LRVAELAINRSIGVQRHGVNQFLASRNIPLHIQANWFALFVKAIFVIALWVGSMWLAASSSRCA
jgi:ABC-type protease/lipase transport system fused ATPase/permease subunit